MPLRIAQVCPYDIDRPGGVQAHIRDTSAALQRLGHEVTIIAPKAASPAQADGLDIRRIGRAAKVRISGTGFEFTLATGTEGRRLKDLMRGGFDVVHYHTVWTPFLPLQARMASDAAAVATFHDTPPDSLGGRLARAGLGLLSRAILPWFEAAVAVSASPHSHLRPGPGRQVAILPPCTDLKRFAAAEPPAETGGPVRLLFVGRLEPRKGCAILLEAYRRLRAEGLDARLSIVGAGPEEPALRRFVAAHNLDGVTFAGRATDADLPGWYAGCDIFCAPSPYGESFGIVVAEAMAAGRPVVAAANRGYATVLTGDAAAFLAAPGDAADLHAKLRTLVLDADARQRLGAWGREQARRYDCETIAPRLAALYREAVLSRAAARRRLSIPEPAKVALAPN
jgi:phosphatidylinositol alpha-mannosyltransferase